MPINISGAVQSVLNTAAGLKVAKEHLDNENANREVASVQASKDKGLAQSSLDQSTVSELPGVIKGDLVTEKEMMTAMKKDLKSGGSTGSEELVDTGLNRQAVAETAKIADAEAKADQFENLSQENKALLEGADDLTKEHFRKQQEQNSTDLEAAKTAFKTVTDKIKARKALRFDREIAAKKLEVLKRGGNR